MSNAAPLTKNTMLAKGMVPNPNIFSGVAASGTWLDSAYANSMNAMPDFSDGKAKNGRGASFQNKAPRN